PVPGNVNPNTPAGRVSVGGGGDHNANLNALAPGVTVSASGNCADRTQRNCTSLDGMDTDAIQAVNTIAADCNCGTSMIITGGTEVGHSGGTAEGTHGGGDKFDLRNNTTIDTHINSWSEAAVGNRSGRLDDGIFCVQEFNPDHWDCKVVN
ncbi:MAG: hypothetical protein ACI9VM_000623, partial [Candidatus Azotimanducaceae bacterium]